MANGRCKMHRGQALRGPDAPAFKHGKYSKALPVQLASKYKEAENDQELLSLSSEIKLLDAFIFDSIEKIGTGESGEYMKRLKQRADALRDARHSEDAAALRSALNELLRFIDKGIGEWAAIQGVRSMLQERKSLVESERKRYVEMGQMITASQVTILISVIADIIRRNVDDRDSQIAIGREIEQLLLAGSVSGSNSAA